jgi:uncharacterized protein YbjQ (UPF0145 family)
MRRYVLSIFLLIGPGCEESFFAHPEHAAAHEHEVHEEHEEHHRAHVPVAPEAVARVQLIESNNIGRETEVMGVVDAHERPGHHEEALTELREEAAALGADAVIGVEFHHGEGHGDRLHLSGMAVRYRKLFRDEPYDVVGTIDVPADMDHQDEAVSELQRRAGMLHADLIISIEYHHGEGNGPVHLTGTAIRYRSSGAIGGLQ